jgi:UDP-sulfoquinovose synthase
MATKNWLSQFWGPTPIKYLPNPRFEPPENEFVVSNDCFLSMGLNPITLEIGLLEEVKEIAQRYKERCDCEKIPATSRWR